MFRYSASAITLALILSACSPVMEANRPDPVDMKQFAIGEDRLKVIVAIGSPLATEKKKRSTDKDDEASDEDDTSDKDNARVVSSCDIYKLYTKGPDGGGKAAIAAGEAVADVFTLGLAEVVFTPVEAGTKNTKHAVTFCYNDDDRLISIDKAEGATGGE